MPAVTHIGTFALMRNEEGSRGKRREGNQWGVTDTQRETAGAVTSGGSPTRREVTPAWASMVLQRGDKRYLSLMIATDASI